MALARFRRDFMAARCPAGGARTRLDVRCVQVDSLAIAVRAFGTVWLCRATVNPTIFSRSLEKRVPLRGVLRMLVFGGIRCKFGLSKMVNGRIA